MSQPVILRSSSVSDFKACPQRFRYKYVEGLTPEVEKEATRMGTSWHGLMEVYRNALLCICPDGTHDECCPVCTPNDPAATAEHAKDVAIQHLAERYKNCPMHVDPADWEREYIVLLYSFVGYLWYWQNDEIETLVTEFPFDLPLHHPRTGLPIPVTEVVRHGTIDKLIRRNGVVSVSDYKSTSRSIDADSLFWGHLRLDTQISMYVMAARELHAQGELAKFGVAEDDVIAGAFYDVWHKPTIKPAPITQAATQEFISTGKYMGIDFEVATTESEVVDADGKTTTLHHVTVNGTPAEVTEGKRGYAIRETGQMFGARLLQDIQDRPTHYFARREIPRTDRDIMQFRSDLYNVYESIKAMIKSGHWFGNERQCEATFRCPYIPICYTGMDVTNGQTPEGMVRDLTTLTIEGQETYD